MAAIDNLGTIHLGIRISLAFNCFCSLLDCHIYFGCLGYDVVSLVVKMTDEEVVKVYQEMREMFGSLPNPEHEPIRFAHYVKLYRYYKSRN